MGSCQAKHGEREYGWYTDLSPCLLQLLRVSRNVGTSFWYREGATLTDGDFLMNVNFPYKRVTSMQVFYVCCFFKMILMPKNRTVGWQIRLSFSFKPFGEWRRESRQ